MKKNLWVILGAMLSTSLLVQSALADSQLTNPPAATMPTDTAMTNLEPATVAPVEPATPAAKPAKKKKPVKRTVKKAARPETIVALSPGPATVTAKAVNVRAQAKLGAEVVAHLTNGDSVTIIEQINLEKAKAGEPKQWAKIAFPTTAEAWVNSSYIDGTNLTVIPKKLNLRAGPGENFSVIGTLESGTAVKQLQTKGPWMQVEPPTGAYAFVAAEYLRQEAPVAPIETNVVAATEPVAVPMDETNTPPAAVEPVVTAPAEPVVEAPPVIIPRVVSHEGVVKPTMSIQAPTKYQLVSLQTGKIINYLYSTNQDLDLSTYNSRLVVVTGEEGLDERWLNTPVITLQHIQVVE